MSKRRVQRQFAASAEAYATSEVHAKGLSLERLLELAEPQPEWRVLDIATGAGHTAITFAPYVRHVIAGDITSQMLRLTASLAHERSLTNVFPVAADAEALPFAEGRFNLLTCRVAAHHFPSLPNFMSESARILRPDGRLAIVDNVVPGSRFSGRKGRAANGAGDFINAFETLRDPSHVRCLSVEAWQRHFYEAGFRLVHQELTDKMLDFHDWCERMRVLPADVVRLEAMLRQAPDAAAEFLQARFSPGRIQFRLLVALFIGIKE